MAAYTGLMTGAGAASGLETLLARLRQEEELAQRQQSLDQTGQYQQGMLGMRGRDLDLEEAGLPSLVAQRGASARASAANADMDTLRMRAVEGLPESEQNIALFPSLRPHAPQDQSQEDLYISGIEQNLGRPLTPQERLSHVSTFHGPQGRGSDLGPVYAGMAQQMFPLKMRAMEQSYELGEQRKAMRRLQIQQMNQEASALPIELRPQLTKMIEEQMAETAPWFEDADEMEERRLRISKQALEKLKTIRPAPGTGADQTAVPQAIPQGVVVRPRAR